MKNVSYIGKKPTQPEEEALEEQPITMDSLLFFAKQLMSADTPQVDQSKPQVSSLESLASRSFPTKRKS